MRSLLTQGLKRLTQKEPSHHYVRGERFATIIAIATVKGGVGKTTTAVNLAASLVHETQRKVLLIDLDAQGHCTTSLSSLMPASPLAHPLSEILLGEDKRQVLDARVSTRQERLDVTPADPKLAEAEGLLGQKIGKELLLRDALSVTRTHYDFILIDCPPNKGNLTLNALLAADHVLIPTDLSPLAVQGADELLETVVTVRERLGHALDVLGILYTRVDGRNTSMNDTIRQSVKEAWGELVFEAQINTSTQLGKAQLAGQPIFEHAPNGRSAQQYRALAHEVLLRLGRSS